MKEFNVIDLFCGCGGLSKGFENAGFNVFLGVDNDNAALTTFEKNHKGSLKLNGDLSEIKTFDVIENLTREKPIDIIVGGPPCQGFSLTGLRNFEDERNRLYLAMIEAVRRFSPQTFIIENVPGMATLYKGQIKEEIIRRFADMGYNVNSAILYATDYGVPQRRKRLVFVGLKNSKIKFKFPKPTYTSENYVTCEEAIGDLPSRENKQGEEVDSYTNGPISDYQRGMRKNTNNLYNHVATNHTQKVKDVISLVPEGGNHKDLPKGVGTSRRFNEAWTR